MARTRTVQGTLRLLVADAAGSMLPIAAITLILLASLVGGGIDMSRAYQVKNRLQYACDAGVLAGRRTVEDDGFDSAARDQAMAFFNGNFDDEIEDANGTSFVPSTPDGGNTIEGIARTNVDTVIMRIFGFDTIALTATCSASMSVGNSDVMMVLDVTGSMAGTISDGNWWTSDPTRLEALQDAMMNFYDTVAAAMSSSTARVRYGFVPYSSTVNVGDLLETNWLVDNYRIETRIADFDQEIVDEEVVGWEPPVHSEKDGVTNSSGEWEDYSDEEFERRRSCEDAMPANIGWHNEGSPVTSEPVVEINGEGQRVETVTTRQVQSSTQFDCDQRGSRRNRYYIIIYIEREREAYHSDIETSDPITEPVFEDVFAGWTYKEFNYDVSQFKTGASTAAPVGDEGTNIFSTWNGCIEERETVAASSFSFSQLLGMSPSGAFDLDLDMIPDATDPATQWRPMWPEVAYVRTQDSGWWGDQLTLAETNEGRRADAFCPRAAQLLTEMTEDAFDDYAESLTPVGSTYHDIGMIWGGRLASPEGLFASNVTEAPENGGAVARHVIFMTDGQMEPRNDIYSAYGIEFYDWRVTGNGTSNLTARHNSRFLAVCEAIKAKGIRVWVIAFGTAMSSNLERCASTDSAFTASNAAELNSSFQEIAKDVGELRVVQ